MHTHSHQTREHSFGEVVVQNVYGVRRGGKKNELQCAVFETYWKSMKISIVFGKPLEKRRMVAALGVLFCRFVARSRQALCAVG